MCETSFSGHNKIMRETQKIGGHCPQNACFTHGNSDKIFIKYSRSLVMWFRNQRFGRHFICNKPGVNTTANVLYRFSDYKSIHMLEKIIFQNH